MPEGHTLHRLATALGDAFAGDPVRVSSPQGRLTTESALLDGTTLVSAESAGKHLFLDFDADRVIHVHLGLIGTFAVTALDGEVPPPVGQVRLRLVNERAYADLRGATLSALISEAQREQVLGRLGPDPLRADAEPDRAWRRISRSNRPVGDLLMDQAVLAGVGNIYRAELLFRHRINPLRPGNTLRAGQWHAMWEDLVVLMADGVLTGRIDTVRPEHTAEAMGRPPRDDRHGGEVYVYRRTGQDCLVCGSTVRTGVLVGRNIFWCPQCQRTFRTRALQ